ncbi:MAG: glutathione S-transferase family protein, partial [Solirubrobacterales bacterium]|nr:glutathione S-transferase family protein [Solirubrobacterales bacterium]
MLTLHDSHGSTNAIKVRVLLHELGLEWTAIELEQGAPRPEGYTDLHPFGLIPTLVDGAVVITESNVALRYLAERAARADLRGATPAERARIDGLLDSLSLELRPALWGVEAFAIYGGEADDRGARVAALEHQLTAYDTLLHP